MTDAVDLNAAFGRALIEHFFQPVPTGSAPDGSVYYAPSGVSILAQQMYAQHATEIVEKVWDRIDLDQFADTVAEKVTAELLRVPGRFNYASNVYRDRLTDRVLEMVAQQLGQRVVDQLDLQLGPKQLEGETP